MERRCLVVSELDQLSARIIGVAIEIHRALGPGLLEAAYAACLVYELRRLGLGVDQERPVPLVYKEVRLPCAYRAAIVVDEAVMLDVKAIEVVTPLHVRQLETLVRLAGCPAGLLLNFGAPTLAEGMHRVLNHAAHRKAAARDPAPRPEEGSRGDPGMDSM